MKKYKEFIDGKNTLTNTFALNTLLEFGRRNLLNEQYYEEMYNNISENKNSFATAEYQKEILKTAKNMAKLKDKDLCEFIYDKIREDKKLEKGR